MWVRLFLICIICAGVFVVWESTGQLIVGVIVFRLVYPVWVCLFCDLHHPCRCVCFLVCTTCAGVFVVTFLWPCVGALVFR